MSELRQNLDQSLLTVSTSPKAKLDTGLLNRESARLSSAADRYSRSSPRQQHGQSQGRRTPSGTRLLISTPAAAPATMTTSLLRGSASVENLHARTTTVAATTANGSGSRGSSGGSSNKKFGGSESGLPARRNLSFDKDV